MSKIKWVKMYNKVNWFCDNCGTCGDTNCCNINIKLFHVQGRDEALCEHCFDENHQNIELKILHAHATQQNKNDTIYEDIAQELCDKIDIVMKNIRMPSESLDECIIRLIDDNHKLKNTLLKIANGRRKSLHWQHGPQGIDSDEWVNIRRIARETLNEVS